MALGWWALGGWAIRAMAGPAVVGPPGSSPALLDATVVTVAPGPSDALTVGVSVRTAAPTQPFAVLWPMAGIREGTASVMDAAAFRRVEAATRARVEGLGCDELAETMHWRSVPGCTSYDYVWPPPDRGDDAVESVGIGDRIAEVTLSLQRIEAAELQEWLAEQGFTIDPDVAAALEPYLAAGVPILTIEPTDEVDAGAWLPPVRFVVEPTAALSLPLVAGEPVASGRQAVHVLTGGGAGAPTPAILNYPREYVPDECMLRRGQAAADWLAEARALFEREAALPPWVLVHAGLARKCDPCTTGPLDAGVLAELGMVADLEEARLARIWFEWDAGTLDQDPELTLDGPPGGADLRFVAHAPEIAAYFPLCGEAAPRAGAPACPNLDDPGGCRTAPPSGSLAAGLGLLLLAGALRRGRAARIAAVLAWIAVAPAPPARAADADGGPKTEIAAAVAVVGTDRIVPAGLRHGAPWALNPFVGLEARRSLFTWRRGRSVGGLVQLRGLAGRAAPWGARGEVGFLLLEPTLGVDLRHGRFREARTRAVFGRYGAGLVLSTLTPGAGPARAVVSGALHAGIGAWLGRGPARTGIELRAGVVPRTDAWETTFHPNVGLPGWLFFPGTANLWVVASRATYLGP